MRAYLNELRRALADSSGETMDWYLELRSGKEVVIEITQLIEDLTNSDKLAARHARIMRILNDDEVAP